MDIILKENAIKYAMLINSIAGQGNNHRSNTCNPLIIMIF